ncbi:MAG: NTP transferase domain-containing protein [Desulfobacterales bacterium]|nr:NTP transferase domain-containing protein [Desulfobacterales bacterium]MBF0396235.1 NTP transferase domain-containing protein [Desulfobacterales bacterium]
MFSADGSKVCGIILAAGLGKRMKSDKAKVLHEVYGKPMIHYVIDSAYNITGNNIIVVIGHQAEKVKDTVLSKYNVSFAHQEKQLGTGHAVLCALPHLSNDSDNVIILCGDVPLIQPSTLKNLISIHIKEKNDATVLAVELEKPKGYGRIILNGNGKVISIIEESDANIEQKLIRLVNSGIYCVKKKFLNDALKEINNDNAQGEMYLTDIVKIGQSHNRNIGIVRTPNYEEVLGINNIEELYNAETIMEKRLAKSLDFN